MIDLPLRGAGGEPADLARTLNSHGFADLAPLHLDEAHTTLTLTLPAGRGRPRRVQVGPGPRKSHARIEVFGRAPSTAVRDELLAGVRHVLRLDQDLSPFYAQVADDPDLAWAAELGAGRMLRSPTTFEDVVKTICTTNVAWSATVRMVNAIVTHLGTPCADPGEDWELANAFPTPSDMAAAPESFYRDVARAGYRATYLRGLAELVASGEVPLEEMAAADPADLSDDELEANLLALPGVGPYAAAHIMLMVGRTSRLILDSWTRPTYAKLMGKRSVRDTAIRRRFRRYGNYAGLAFWLVCTRDWVEVPRTPEV